MGGMMQLNMRIVVVAFGIGLLLAGAKSAMAHCDTLDGPVRVLPIRV